MADEELDFNQNFFFLIYSFYKSLRKVTIKYAIPAFHLFNPTNTEFTFSICVHISLRYLKEQVRYIIYVSKVLFFVESLVCNLTLYLYDHLT